MQGKQKAWKATTNPNTNKQQIKFRTENSPQPPFIQESIGGRFPFSFPCLIKYCNYLGKYNVQEIDRRVSQQAT